MELIVVIGIVLITNLVCFFLMRYDKQCARQGKRRIPEWMLFLSAGCFGAFGGVMAMNILRHKTRHWYFKAFFPLVLIVQVERVMLEHTICTAGGKAEQNLVDQ